MTVSITLRNTRFPWNHTRHGPDDCWWKGEIFVGGAPIEIDDLVDRIVSEENDRSDGFSQLGRFLHGLNGSFVFVIESPDRVLAVVDGMRSIPIFYRASTSSLQIVDTFEHSPLRSASELSEQGVAELLVTGYITADRTIMNEFFQVRPGHFLHFDKAQGILTIHPYFQYLFDRTEERKNIADYIAELDDVLVNVFERCLTIARRSDRHVVIPLSGGLDSRIIAAMLKRLGASDVTCFSYGIRQNRESRISKSVAEALGYEWLFTEYTDENVYRIYNSELMRQYIKYGSNGVSASHIQDFFALYDLVSRDKIRENAIFLPGHSGNMFRGYLLDESDWNQADPSTQTAAEAIFKKHYRLWDIGDLGEIKQMFLEEISRSISDVEIHSTESYINALDYFNINERQAKFIVNSVRAYEFFGFSWGIPLLDRDLVDYFLKVPLDIKIREKLLIRWYNSKIVSELPELKDIECTTNLSIDDGAGNTSRNRASSNTPGSGWFSKRGGLSGPLNVGINCLSRNLFRSCLLMMLKGDYFHLDGCGTPFNQIAERHRHQIILAANALLSHKNIEIVIDQRDRPSS